MLKFGIPELPELISVESCLISREEARLKNINYFDMSAAVLNQQVNNHLKSTLPPLTMLQNNVDETMKNSIPMTRPMLPTISPYPVLKTFTDAEVLTDGPNPTRDRLIQTEMLNPVTIGIQCNIEEELQEIEFKKMFETSEENIESTEDLKKRFIEFVKNNTKRFENGYFECIFCGEIKLNAKLMASHMAIHFGPTKLCFQCGIQFDHKVFWKNHNCAAKRPRRKQFLKCPHYFCGVNALSPAELYDHLNEHCGMKIYHCTNCQRGFATARELQLHCKIHKKCRKGKSVNFYKLPLEHTKHRKRAYIVRRSRGKKILVKKFLSQVTKSENQRSRLCCVCLMRCKNLFHYQRHIKRCLKLYRRRLKCKRTNSLDEKATKLILTNGINGEHKE